MQLQRRLDGLSDSASAIGFTQRAKNDRVIMQHFPTQQENMSTYAIKVLSRREIRETAQGSAPGWELTRPFSPKKFCLLTLGHTYTSRR